MNKKNFWKDLVDSDHTAVLRDGRVVVSVASLSFSLTLRGAGKAYRDGGEPRLWIEGNGATVRVLRDKDGGIVRKAFVRKDGGRQGVVVGEFLLAVFQEQLWSSWVAARKAAEEALLRAPKQGKKSAGTTSKAAKRAARRAADRARTSAEKKRGSRGEARLESRHAAKKAAKAARKEAARRARGKKKRGRK